MNRNTNAVGIVHNFMFIDLARRGLLIAYVSFSIVIYMFLFTNIYNCYAVYLHNNKNIKRGYVF